MPPCSLCRPSPSSLCRRLASSPAPLFLPTRPCRARSLARPCSVLLVPRPWLLLCWPRHRFLFPAQLPLLFDLPRCSSPCARSVSSRGFVLAWPRPASMTAVEASLLRRRAFASHGRCNSARPTTLLPACPVSSSCARSTLPWASSSLPQLSGVWPAPIHVRSYRHRRVVAGDSFACASNSRVESFSCSLRALSARLALIPISSSNSSRLSSSVVLVAVRYCTY
jgi:hypothetical protein